METERNGELDTHAFEGMLSGIANHEAKALTLAYMCSQADFTTEFASEDLDRGLLQIQGGTPAWRQSPGLPLKYCEQSFEPIGGVVKSKILRRNRWIAAYELTDKGRNEGLALAGLILDWSIRYPEVSVQDVFGNTQSKTANRSPANRLAILESILTSADEAPSFPEIAADHPDKTDFENVIWNMRGSSFEKVTSISTNRKNYDPLLSLYVPEVDVRKPRQKMKPETQAIYRTLEYLRDTNGIEAISMNDFVDLVEETNTDIDPKLVRKALMMQVVSGKKGLIGIALAENGRGELGDEKASRISIKPEHQEAISELVNALHNFRFGIGHQNWRDVALAITANPEFASHIMAKAYENSPKIRARRNPESLGSAIVSIIQAQADSLSVPQLREKLADEKNILVGKNAIRNVLGRLVSSSILVVEQRETIEHGQGQNLKYYGRSPEIN